MGQRTSASQPSNCRGFFFPRSALTVYGFSARTFLYAVPPTCRVFASHLRLSFLCASVSQVIASLDLTMGEEAKVKLHWYVSVISPENNLLRLFPPSSSFVATETHTSPC